jgi:hypothetical protein
MTAYVGLDSLPAELRSRLAPLGEGAHDIHERRSRTAADELELQVAVAPLPGRPEKLYLVFTVSDIEAEDRPPENLIRALFVGLAVVMGLVILLGSALTSAVVRPLSDLARLVRSTNADELPERIHPEKSMKKWAFWPGPCATRHFEFAVSSKENASSPETPATSCELH